jgi:hypothetical protein
MFGPAAMLILIIMILETGDGWFAAPSTAFLIVLGITILARCMDFRSGNPQTVTGGPATTGHLDRYVPAALVLGLAVWAAANLIGNR